MHGKSTDGAPEQERLIAWRWATADDVDRYYNGDRPDVTIRAIVVILDGEPVGIVGMLRRKIDFVAFSEFKPELEPYLKSITVARAIKAAQRMFLTAPMPVVVCETSNPRLIERLGFRLIAPGVHQCRN